MRTEPVGVRVTRRPPPRVISLLLFLLPILVGPASTAFGQIYQASLEELAKTSSAIVVGTATNARAFWTEDKSRIMTEVTLRVDETVAGTASGETIITIPGGRVGNSVYEVSDMPVFLEGEEVVVFLWQDASGRNLVTGGSQGRIGISTDQQLQRRVVIDAPPQTRSEMDQNALTRRTDVNDDTVTPPKQVMLLDQLVSKIREAREK